MPLVGNPLDWAKQDQQGHIYDAIVRAADGGGISDHAAGSCDVCNTAWRALVPALGSEPLRFYRNPTSAERAAGMTGRIELPHGKDRSRKLKHKIYEIHAYIASGEWATSKPATPATPATRPATPKADSDCQRDAHEVIDWIQGKLRPFAIARNADGKPFDQIGLRPAQNAAKLLTQGLPVPAIKHALTLHYPGEARRALGVAAYDPQTFRPREWKGVVKPSDLTDHNGRHKAMPYLRAVTAAGVPAALIGPPGTGKTTMAQHLAEDLNLPFGFVSMTRGTSPSTFNGRPRLAADGTDALVQALLANGRTQEALELAMGRADEGDTVASQFAKIYGGGGVWLFDEMDAAEPSLLLLVNAALANGVFSPASGEPIKMHPNFIPIAGMNTLGLGGDRQMVGREKQDAAALDRWHAGRIEVAIDEALERNVYWNTVAA